jgi:hypothetical protein
MTVERLAEFNTKFPHQLTFPQWVEILAEIARAHASEDALAAQVEDLQEQLDELEE